MFYGSDRPEPAVNVHELVLDTAFRILMRTLFGEEDDFIIANSRRVRWALQRPDLSNETAKKIIRDWTNDTTGGTMTFCLMELCRHPEWQRKAQAEADEIFETLEREGGHGLRNKDFNRMSVLTKCINETLRLWNAVRDAAK